ncbi:MAG: hypothetical protein WC761_04985 [Candidatus Paceibacterota bacterium]|jgi:undecaprenyl pyrophosphate phosphatase UppP
MNPVDDFQKQVALHTRVWTKFVRTQNQNFWVLVAFLPTFVIARLVVYNFPNLFLEIRGVHVHHLTYGIILLSIAGLWSLNITSHRQKTWCATLYGVGLALAFDEFGMWLHLEDNYWIRHSYDAVVIITAILFNVVYLSIFWKKILGLYKKEEESHTH